MTIKQNEISERDRGREREGEREERGGKGVEGRREKLIYQK